MTGKDGGGGGGGGAREEKEEGKDLGHEDSRKHHDTSKTCQSQSTSDRT